MDSTSWSDSVMDEKSASAARVAEAEEGIGVERGVCIWRNSPERLREENYK